MLLFLKWSRRRLQGDAPHIARDSVRGIEHQPRTWSDFEREACLYVGGPEAHRDAAEQEAERPFHQKPRRDQQHGEASSDHALSRACYEANPCSQRWNWQHNTLHSSQSSRDFCDGRDEGFSNRGSLSSPNSSMIGPATHITTTNKRWAIKAEYPWLFLV